MNKGQLRRQVERRLAHNARFTSYEEFEKFLDDVSTRARELGVSLKDLGRLTFIIWVYDEIDKPVIWGMTDSAVEAEQMDEAARAHYQPHTTKLPEENI
jgi:hypothetical protein